MTNYEYELFKALNSENPFEWGLVEDCNSSQMFGTIESVDIKGKYLYVYLKTDDIFSFLNKFTPTYTFIRNDELLLLYGLGNK
jgi:hypothetical protein